MVKVYTMNHCPYCVKAKALLKKREIAFEEILVDRNDDVAREKLFKLSAMKTLPQIFSNDKLIGGFTELAELDQKDQLISLK